VLLASWCAHPSKRFLDSADAVTARLDDFLIDAAFSHRLRQPAHGARKGLHGSGDRRQVGRFEVLILEAGFEIQQCFGLIGFRAGRFGVPSDVARNIACVEEGGA
jgi:hypothetical protein